MVPVKLFEQKKARSHYDPEKEVWYFSVIDVIEILTESPRPRKYWNALKTKLSDEGSELSQKLGQLKMEAGDGKLRETDVADTETLFQSIPSPKEEPFKLWLAKVGYERMQQISDYWNESGVELPDEFAMLTNIIRHEWTVLTVKKHKDLKGLKSQNLRAHISEAELIFTA